ncbi:MAG: HAMP domain-containing histidine kinase [Flavobacteriales bacterium]|nr:HAMP domain-containing histidine kinase [Flavobacteriales bacterium]MCB9197634.1 HAMP domain-containing histidine kinase [Flavobacteriales bacterium]
MSKLSFKRRIASNFIVATAILVAVVFAVVYFIVHFTVYSRLDNDLRYEADKHLTEVHLENGQLKYIDLKGLEEEEHREVQVNPVFIQLFNADQSVSEKSPNLKANSLEFKIDKINSHFTTTLAEKQIRQLQIPYLIEGKTVGYIVTAMSLESTLIVLSNLLYTLLISFPVILIGLFFTSYILAARSIEPVMNITATTHKITQNNLSERVELPANDDELHQLVESINDLLDRIQGAIVREKQFTSDASHELRTPISVIQGTLEVLVRKTRTPQEYEEKIVLCLNEITRMNEIIDQLLEMARFENKPMFAVDNTSNIKDLIHQIIVRRSNQIDQKHLTIKVNSEGLTENCSLPSFHGNLILDNLVSNAIKYSENGGLIEINLIPSEDCLRCEISDNGIGVSEEDLERIFQPFFRSDALQHKQIKGVGLGLSIVRKAADSLGASIEVFSQKGKGSLFVVNFKRILRKD